MDVTFFLSFVPLSVLFVHWELVRRVKKLLQQVYRVNRRDEARPLLFPPAAADAIAVGRTF